MYATFQLCKPEGFDFKFNNSFFKFQSSNTQKKHFWSQIKVSLFFHKILHLDKFEDFDFKTTIIFQKSGSNILKKKFGIFDLTRNFAVMHVRGR